jgi:hypothetical protein
MNDSGMSARPDHDWLAQLLATGTIYVATAAPDLTLSGVIGAPEGLNKSARAVDLGGCADQTFYAAEEAKWEPRTAVDYLSAAEDAQTARASDYDSPGGERSVGDTVRAFNALTGHQLTEVEGWQFLMLLKLKRLNSAHGVHMDSCVDAVSYASLMAEAQGR